MSETTPITEQANPETELARDRCSPEDLPHDALQTVPRTEPVVQVENLLEEEEEEDLLEVEDLLEGEDLEDLLEEEEEEEEEEEDLLEGEDLEDLLEEEEEEEEEDLEDLFEVEYLLEGEEEEEYSGGLGGAVEANRKRIWSWLMNDEISTIGIYGMGGIGKTTLLQHIHNELLRRPDISHHVYWVTVPQDFSIYRLQNLIARHLDLDLSSEYDTLPRAAKLSEELTKKQEWILILEDLWESFELSAVGIPVPLKGCKVIFTTRLRAVCHGMDSQVITEVRPLSEREACTLFMEKLGHGIALSPEVERIAVDIARECAGWPLGIITMAGSLRGVDDEDEWRNTLQKLKESKSRDMGDKVLRMLRFSYDRLDDKLQQSLLYCALFPEGHEIEREELIDYLIDGGIIENMWSREAAFDEGHAMLDRLENAGLLQRIDGGRVVEMHDIIREMAVHMRKENPSVMDQIRKCIEMARLKSGWTLLLTNLILELASAVFDQLGYALVGMVLAFVALLLATAERMNLLPSFLLPRKERMARRERRSLLPISHRPSTGKPVCTIVEYFGLVGAVWQCFYSTVEYAYASQKKDNPIKTCLLPSIFLLCVGQERKRIEKAGLKSGWTLLMTNLILEIASAVFDQLGNALVGMVLAFVALVLSTAELIYMERMSILPLFRRPSTRTLAPWKPVGSIVEYFGWVGAVWQCFYSTVAYAYAHQKRDNPIKMCLLPSIFLSCAVISKLIKKSYID